jgi:hypothetical protein
MMYSKASTAFHWCSQADHYIAHHMRTQHTAFTNMAWCSLAPFTTVTHPMVTTVTLTCWHPLAALPAHQLLVTPAPEAQHHPGRPSPVLAHPW